MCLVFVFAAGIGAREVRGPPEGMLVWCRLWDKRTSPRCFLVPQTMEYLWATTVAAGSRRTPRMPRELSFDESRRRRGRDVEIPRRRVAATPRLRRGYSAEASRCDVDVPSARRRRLLAAASFRRKEKGPTRKISARRPRAKLVRGRPPASRLSPPPSAGAAASNAARYLRRETAFVHMALR